MTRTSYCITVWKSRHLLGNHFGSSKYYTMKSSLRHLLTFFAFALVLIPVEALAQDKKAPCTEDGSARSGKKGLSEEQKEFNRKKNRDSAEPAENPLPLSFEQLWQGRTKVDDQQQWQEGQYVELSGAYLIDFKQQKGETCNCYEADTNSAMGDVHINIGNKALLDEGNNNYYIVIEITPSYKKLHPNYKAELEALKGKAITVRGYLFYDSEHERNSINYCKTCSDRGLWRKTCWEVHPVTFIGPGN